MARRASPGEGRPYQRRWDGRWVVAVRDKDNRRKYLYGWSRADVIAKRDEAMAAARLGVDVPSRKLTVGRQLTDWLDDRRGKVRSSTWISYESHVRLHLASLHPIPLTKLQPADVRRMLRQRESEGCAPRTAAYSLTVLRMALRQAVADNLITRNVAEHVAPPKATRHELTILSASEIRALVADGDPLWVFLVGTGCRLGEALAVRWQDIARGSVTFAGSLRPIDRRIRSEGEKRLQRVEPKTETGRRTVALPEFVQATLVKDDRPASVHGYVFTTPRGTPLDPRNVSRAWGETRERVGLPAVRIHDLRHTYASQLLAAGYTLEDVKRALGHSSIAQTSNTYGHLVEGRSRELASGMDRLVRGA